MYTFNVHVCIKKCNEIGGFLISIFDEMYHALLFMAFWPNFEATVMHI